MQPLQDITIDSSVSRTQYQFVVESTDDKDFATWIPPLMQKLDRCPSSAMSPAIWNSKAPPPIS
jgi:multidrug efflux pump